MPNAGIAEALHFPKLQGATGNISYCLTDETKSFLPSSIFAIPRTSSFFSREGKQSSINYRVSPYRLEYQHLF